MGLFLENTDKPQCLIIMQQSTPLFVNVGLLLKSEKISMQLISVLMLNACLSLVLIYSLIVGDMPL